jgi:hypothetical protein
VRYTLSILWNNGGEPRERSLLETSIMTHGPAGCVEGSNVAEWQKFEVNLTEVWSCERKPLILRTWNMFKFNNGQGVYFHLQMYYFSPNHQTLSNDVTTSGVD